MGYQARRNTPLMVPDGHVRPVYQYSVYRDLLLPGQMAVPRPGIRFGQLICYLPRPRRFEFKDVHTRDNKKLDFTINVEYAFDPRKLNRDQAADQLKYQEQDRHYLVKKYLEHTLRRLMQEQSSERILKNPDADDLSHHLYIRILNPLRAKGIYLESARSIYIEPVKLSEGQEAAQPASAAAQQASTAAQAQTSTPQAQPQQQTPPTPTTSPSAVPHRTAAAVGPPPDDMPEKIPEPVMPVRPDVLRNNPSSEPEISEMIPPEMEDKPNTGRLTRKRPDVLRKSG